MVHPQEPPVLDFSVFYGSDSQAKTKLLQDIRECCLKNGFFQITGHRVSRELQRRTMSCVERFFDLPLEEKLKIDRSIKKKKLRSLKSIALTFIGRNPFNRGYEVMQSHMSQPGSSPDLKEGLFIGQDLPVHHPYCVEKKFNCGPNVWPEALDDLEEFKCTTMEYYDAVFQLAKDIIAVLALTINGDEGLFAPYTDGAVATLRYLHYPPQPPKTYDNARGCGAHRDYSGITILLQDEVGGLQVLDEPTGQWIDVRLSLSHCSLSA